MQKPFDISAFRKGITKSIPGLSTGFNDPKTWINTGSYALNYLLTGDFNRGIPLGKVSILAGESGSGKSLLAANIIKNAQDMGIYVILIDTENALDETWLKEFDVDTAESKLLKLNMAMVDDVAKTISEFVKEYRNIPDNERPEVLFVIDSLGMLLVEAQTAQFERGDLRGDFGHKAKGLKALITNCVNMFGNLGIGLLATNHTMPSQNLFSPDDVVSGGCLTQGHKIIMADGQLKEIENVEIDDSVQTMFGPDKVTSLWWYEKPTITLALSDGTTVTCSKEHKFLTISEEGQIWKTAEELNERDEIISI